VWARGPTRHHGFNLHRLAADGERKTAHHHFRFSACRPFLAFTVPSMQGYSPIPR
jgi:hypothetical protein